MFKDMPHNQMDLIMLIDGFKEQYILENENSKRFRIKRRHLG
jgi:hypothetical protein